VCAEPLDAQEQDEDELDAAREAVAQAEEQLRTAQDELAAAGDSASAADTGRSTAEAAVRELEERQPAGNEARELENQIARLIWRSVCQVCVCDRRPGGARGCAGGAGVPGAARAGSAVRRRCQADIRGLGTS
jgi:hypothetical protein